MALKPVRHFLEVVDVNGDHSLVSYPTTADDATTTLANLETASTNFAAAVAACTNSLVVKRSFSMLLDEAHLVVGSSPPNNAIWPSVTDGARLTFKNNKGERFSLTIPAPLATDFGAGSNVVDSTDPNIDALITLLQVQAMNPNGTAYNLYDGGAKTGKRARRRRNNLVP